MDKGVLRTWAWIFSLQVIQMECSPLLLGAADSAPSTFDTALTARGIGELPSGRQNSILLVSSKSGGGVRQVPSKAVGLPPEMEAQTQHLERRAALTSAMSLVITTVKAADHLVAAGLNRANQAVKAVAGSVSRNVNYFMLSITQIAKAQEVALKPTPLRVTMDTDGTSHFQLPE